MKNTMIYNKKIHMSKLWCIPAITLFLSGQVYAVSEINFNTDILDAEDKENIDLSKFANESYIVPGAYSLDIKINKISLPEQSVPFYISDYENKNSSPCITKELKNKIGLKNKFDDSLIWWHDGECLDVKSLAGTKVTTDLSLNTLYISIPQAYLEYTSDDWDPISSWDDGLPGVIFDYNLSMRANKEKNYSEKHSIYGSGTSGFNAGPWRFRSDWQTKTNSGEFNRDSLSLEWNRYYAYRAIPHIHSKLAIGENFLTSGIFDSFRYTGASVFSEDSMLPPNLRGYAPEVTGLAKTNARVIISKQGKTIYDTTVPAGPFRIQDISNSVSGELDVRIEEADGSIKTYKINTSSIPYLTRPGTVRYKIALGKPSDYRHNLVGPSFLASEFSWGVDNGWSLYGGAIASSEYKSLALGIGRDLLALGAISIDVTKTDAFLSNADNHLQGKSYRLSYSKNFDEYNSQITFAGYRFSDKNFMSMSEWIDNRFHNSSGNGKEMYTLTFNKQFVDEGVTSYLSYSHETYWDRRPNDRYNLSVSKYFDFGSLRNVSISVSGYTNTYYGVKDEGGYLSISVPWKNDSSISYNSEVNKNDITSKIGYYKKLDNANNYQVSAGKSRRGNLFSGYLSHDSDAAQLSANFNYQENAYSAVGMNIQGGLTLTGEGGAFHRIGIPGGARVLIDTNHIQGVPVHGYGSNVESNIWGKAVIGEVNSYNRNNINVDLNKMSDDVESSNSVVQATLTEGAIGYRRFQLISGKKAMATIKLSKGGFPPFGSSIVNSDGQEVGIVADKGSVYLSGINKGAKMIVRWGAKNQCNIYIPNQISDDILQSELQLICSSDAKY